MTPRGSKSDQAQASADSFPVVAIGASAGGLEAYTELFKALPADTGMAFVLVQHLDPTHHSMLAGIISGATKMPVAEVKSGVRLKPNHVYVIPPNAFMAIAKGAFTLTPRSKEPGLHLSINFFMRSLAEERKNKAIGVVLSGTGGDGALGVAAIRAEAGVNFAQDPASAKYDGMPRSAIATGCVDFVLPVEGIAQELDRITRHPYVRQIQEGEEEAKEVFSPDKGHFAKILDQLRKVSGADFSQYKPNTIQRRTMRRMMLLKMDSMKDYAEHLRGNPDETEKLYDDVLIPVTSFFRDFEAFEALKSQVFPAIVKQQGNKGAIRMWAPGCSTGEETYSLAMTLLEFLGDKAGSFQLQLFGTDLNERGIQRARTGLYRESIAEEISPERMRRFFVKVEDGYRVNKAVRDMCVFARQNLASDPPFSQMNLVACRNLLIYMGTALQKKVVPILHYALKPSGFLMLGSSESLSAFPDFFTTLDKKHKIYEKKPTVSRLHYDFSQTRPSVGSGANLARNAPAPQGAPERQWDVQVEADRVVLKNHAPVGVVVNSAMEVVQFRGRTTPYLEPAPGKPTQNILKLAQNGLAVELRALITAARTQSAPAKKEGVPFEGDGKRRILNLSVSPLGEKNSSGEERYFLVLFDDVTSHRIPGPGEVAQQKAKAGREKGREPSRLKRELADTKDALRAAIESEEATKEEFQSANEEVLSANEELQSTNEELETSKEELQSSNEELNTLNEELRHKNTELHDLNNDVSNLLNSTQIPVVMLDRNLRIRRLTRNAEKLLNAAPTDVGRPISDIRLNIKVSDLEPMIMKVLEGLQPVARDVQDSYDHWHSLHILPYKTLDNKIDGVVLALQDINAIKSANEQLRKSTEFFRNIINTVREPLLVLDPDLRVVATNDPFLRAFKVSSEQIVNKFLYRLGEEQWNIPRLRAMLEEVLPKSQAVRDFEVALDFKNIGPKRMLLNAQGLFQANDRNPMILLAFEDITERKLAEAALIKSEKLIFSGRLVASLAHEINNPLQAVMNLMALLGQSQGLNPQDQEYATLAASELARVVNLIRQSLGIYREATSPTVLNLAEVLDSTLSLYAKQLETKGITVTKQYRLEGPIRGYPGEIRQVFSTLLVNAMDASIKGGPITVRARKSADWRDPSVRGVRIVVSDRGVGIPAGDAARIFEPFFTTKEDRGTGLGLWVTRGVVTRRGGSIRVRSRSGGRKSGTCFSIFLPDQDHGAVAQSAGKS